MISSIVKLNGELDELSRVVKETKQELKVHVKECKEELEEAKKKSHLEVEDEQGEEFKDQLEYVTTEPESESSETLIIEPLYEEELIMEIHVEGFLLEWMIIRTSLKNLSKQTKKLSYRNFNGD